MSYNYQNELKELSNQQLVDLCPSIGQQAPHSKASSKYSFVPTLQAINHLRDGGWVPTACNEVAAKNENTQGFQRHMIRFSRPDLVLHNRRMEMALFNSHDTGSSFLLIGGALEFICSNACMSGDIMAEARHRHVGFDGQKFIEAAARISGYLEKTAPKIEEYETIELSPDERGVYARAAHQIVYGIKEPEDHIGELMPAMAINTDAPVGPSALLQRRRWSQNKKNDLWTTFQNVQENVIKGGLRGRGVTGRRTSTRAVKSIEKDRKLNQALWTLTTEMARLKKAA